jgi:hypothetical protein
MDQIIESAATNSGNGHIPSTSSGLRTATIRKNVQATPSGGRFAVSPSIIKDSECISRTEVELLLKELIRIHVATLLGLRPGEPIPPPATEAERAQWISQPDENIDDRADDNNPSDTDMSDLDDPHFPYPNGPGHADASSQTLKFIKGEMDRFGISSFRPNFAKSWRSSANAFLWKFAVETFIQLVERREYTGINLQMYGRPTITSRMKLHVKDTWQRNSVIASPIQ